MTAIIPEAKRNARSRRHIAIALTCAMALGAGSVSVPRPAKAEPATIMTMVEAFLIMYEIFSIGEEIFGSEDEYGPLILERLDRAQTAPAHWSMYDNWLQPAMQTNYDLIAANTHECWEGFNPGHFEDSPERNFDYLVRKQILGKWKTSRLYKWIADRNYRTYKKEGWANRRSQYHPADGTTSSWCEAVTYHHKCNPQSGVCTVEPIWCNQSHPTDPYPNPRVTLRKCASGVSDMSCARSQAEEAFHGDPVVQTIAASMDQIMRRSGGNFGVPDSTNDLFLFHGRIVDPWVVEPSCPSGYAYPQRP
jgi:hypothetical protein